MFFPPAHPVLTPPLDDYQYPPPQWKFQNITDKQVHRAILKMKPFKASRSRMVQNSVLIYAREDLIPHLTLLFHTTNTLTLTSNVSRGLWYFFLGDNGHPHPLPHFKCEWGVLVFFSR
jgi:hypothetical protein